MPKGKRDRFESDGYEIHFHMSQNDGAFSYVRSVWETLPAFPPNGYDRNCVDLIRDPYENHIRYLDGQFSDAIRIRHKLNPIDIKIDP